MARIPFQTLLARFSSPLEPGAQPAPPLRQEHQDVLGRAAGRQREESVVGEHLALPEPRRREEEPPTAAHQSVRGAVQLQGEAPGRAGPEGRR